MVHLKCAKIYLLMKKIVKSIVFEFRGKKLEIEKLDVNSLIKIY